jgi:hypothetical protein
MKEDLKVDLKVELLGCKLDSLEVVELDCYKVH